MPRYFSSIESRIISKGKAVHNLQISITPVITSRSNSINVAFTNMIEIPSQLYFFNKKKGVGVFLLLFLGYAGSSNSAGFNLSISCGALSNLT